MGLEATPRVSVNAMGISYAGMPSGVLSIGEAFERMRRAVFRLRIEKNQQSGMWEWGTAFFVGQGIALTAYHNLPSDKSSGRCDLTAFHQGEELRLTCFLDHSLCLPQGDIAVLELVGAIPTGTAWLELGFLPRHTPWRDRVRFLAGRSVCVFGFPFEQDSQVSKLVPGLIDSCQPLAERDWKEQHGEGSGVVGLTEWLRIHTDDNANLLPGISGAPILDRETGLVIGVQHSYIPKLKVVYGTELTPLAGIWPSFGQYARPFQQHFIPTVENNATLALEPKALQTGALRGLLPLPPRMLVGREDVIDDLRSRLVSSGLRLDESAQFVQVILGVPGVGKTSVASALAHDLRLRTSFPDGVLWASLGQKPNTHAILEDWLNALTGNGVKPGMSIGYLKAQLTSILSNQRMLLAIDDVWEATDAEFLRVGALSAVL